MSNSKHDVSKRKFIKTAAYVAPAILTLKATPSFASAGSGRGNNGVGNGEDGQPPGNEPINDGPGTSPGSPGMKPSLRGGSFGGRRRW
jgi:hypothetical protein